MIVEKQVNSRMGYSQFIENNSNKRFGRPCVKGTRISVSDVVNWLANGLTVKSLVMIQISIF